MSLTPPGGGRNHKIGIGCIPPRGPQALYNIALTYGHLILTVVFPQMEMFFLLPLRCDEVASPLFVTRSDVLWMSRSFILFMFECFFFYSSVFMAFDVGLLAMLPVILFSLTNLLYFF